MDVWLSLNLCYFNAVSFCTYDIFRLDRAYNSESISPDRNRNYNNVD